jgi:L-threonylcarbamoyladenylate synthase
MRISDDPHEAAAYLKAGKIVIFPTETVYGIGASALDHTACRKIYAIKGRPSDNPLILHIGSREAIPSFGEIDKKELLSLAPFIPGPLTLILKKKVAELFSAQLKTVGLRVPAHELCLEMLKQVPFPIAAPSANLSGRPSLTRIEDVIDIFGGKVDLILKGEDPILGLESTVIDLSEDLPLYLRAGMVGFDDLLPFLPNLKRWKGDEKESPPSPGMKYRHYAPHAKVIIYQTIDEIMPNDSFAEIGFETTKKGLLSKEVLTLTEYARELYAFFTLSDKRGIKEIYCQEPREGALRDALLERLQKASRASS